MSKARLGAAADHRGQGMANLFTKTEDTGYGSRVGGSFMSALFGILLFVLAFPLHFWNEGRAVAEHKALQEGATSVVDAPITPVSAAMEGKLVHVGGKATAAQPVSDTQFGVSAQALALERKVEMFQWQEHKKTRTEKKLGGGERKITEYSYDTAWDDDVIDSKQFEHPEDHTNPGKMPFSSTRIDANPVHMGDLVLAPSFANRIGNEEVLVPKLADLPPNLGATFQLDDGRLVTSKTPASPEVGDVRVQWSRVPEQVLSVVGLQHAGVVESYTASNGREVALLESGEISAKQMFAAAESRNNQLTWMLRVGGTFLMWLGMVMFLGPIARILDFLPFLGNLVEGGVMLVSALLAFCLSSVTIAVAWFFYRPIVGIAMIAIAVGAALLLRKRAQRPPPPPMGMPPPPPMPG
jgi:hypothetical protein